MINHLIEILRCPKCASQGKGKLAFTGDGDLECQETECQTIYPVSDGVPVMLTEAGDFLGIRHNLMAVRQAD